MKFFQIFYKNPLTNRFICVIIVFNNPFGRRGAMRSLYPNSIIIGISIIAIGDSAASRLAG